MSAVIDKFQAQFAEIERQRAAQRPAEEQLRRRGGGGTSGGVTDDWKISVDLQLAQLHGDVRMLLYGLIGGFLFVIGMIGGLWMHVDDKSARLQDRLNQTDLHLAHMDEKLDQLVERKRETARKP